MISRCPIAGRSRGNHLIIQLSAPLLSSSSARPGIRKGGGRRGKGKNYRPITAIHSSSRAAPCVYIYIYIYIYIYTRYIYIYIYTARTKRSPAISPRARARACRSAPRVFPLAPLSGNRTGGFDYPIIREAPLLCTFPIGARSARTVRPYRRVFSPQAARARCAALRRVARVALRACKSPCNLSPRPARS